ncbi:MAG TPA: hypothetical protein VK762_21790 [Polyangiaceae bacterium]|jgi:hypothetical protein|nr:hypothetical protein [Polyangiaceae bacterium]
MLDRVRDALYRAMTGTAGDALAPVRIQKDLARRLNTTLGRPLAPLDELAKRARGRARLAELRARPAAVAAAPPATGKAAKTAAKVAAPVLVYFEKDVNVRELLRIEELLGAKGYAWTRLDVAGDEVTLDFVMRAASCERDDLPVVFVADKPIGNHVALVEAEVSGELARIIAAG